MYDSAPTSEVSLAAEEYVFVISQIGEKGSPERKRANEVYDYIVKEVAQTNGLASKRSDLDPTPGQITTQIIQGIINAKVVVADLTGRNPNVYYELGVANSFAKPTILLVRDTAGLPFDVRNERMIVLGDADVLGVGEAAEAKKALQSAFDVVLKPDFKVANLVTEAAAARSLDALAPDDPIASELSALRDKLDELASLTEASTSIAPNWADVEELKELLEYYAARGNLPPTWLERIDKSNTTIFFDEWLDNLTATANASWSQRRKSSSPSPPPPPPPLRHPVTDDEPF
jgi:hypothetical protein